MSDPSERAIARMVEASSRTSPTEVLKTASDSAESYWAKVQKLIDQQEAASAKLLVND